MDYPRKLWAKSSKRSASGKRFRAIRILWPFKVASIKALNCWYSLTFALVAHCLIWSPNMTEKWTSSKLYTSWRMSVLDFNTCTAKEFLTGISKSKTFYSIQAPKVSGFVTLVLPQKVLQTFSQWAPTKLTRLLRNLKGSPPWRIDHLRW